jgi:hypothetical protein
VTIIESQSPTGVQKECKELREQYYWLADDVVYTKMVCVFVDNAHPRFTNSHTMAGKQQSIPDVWNIHVTTALLLVCIGHAPNL